VPTPSDIERVIDLHKSALPEKERERMSQALDREVEMLTPKTRPLPPPEDMVEK
jgi:hypothetical protein